MRTQYRQNTPLTESQLKHVAPSIFAAEAHISRSERYTYIPTAQILNALRKEGFEPFSVGQTRVRNEDKREFTKHLIRLRHVTNSNAKVGEEFNEIILLNSHDGSSSYQIMSGVFRLICSNGLVCGNATNDIRIPHKGDVIGRVVEGAYEILDNFKAIDDSKDNMKSLILNPSEQRIFAGAALELKYDETEKPINEEQLLRPRRYDDNKSDLWTTFNRVQENIIKGGLLSRTANSRRYTHTRAVTGIDQSIKLNRALWTLAESMKQLKAA